uniref:Uncharacterized protein LOC111118080 n=1 Tax=Crassostrea virginica TaxID=6565 RepID=A0A8B8CD48_CRAVI|nr:uncharacterized protein LOC111118080 [Crassostrea virginica]
MKHLQIFVVLLLIALSVAQKDYRRSDVQRKIYPKLCYSDGECPENSKCLKKDSRGICIPKRMVDIFEKEVAKLSLLRVCSGDGDCTGADKCTEVPKIGARMCMPEFFGKMLQKKMSRVPANVKTCASEADCTGSSKCVEFPKFEKKLCLYENGRFHKMLKIIHDRYTTEDKKLPDQKKDEELEKKRKEELERKKEELEKKKTELKKKMEELEKKMKEGLEKKMKEEFEKKKKELEKMKEELEKKKKELEKKRKDESYNFDKEPVDDKDNDVDDKKNFISDPQFLTDKENGKEDSFGSDEEHHGRKRKSHPWSMFFMGALAMTGVVIILLTVGMCCLKIRGRKDTALPDEETTASNLKRNAFLTKISTVSKNPYSKLENEKI